VKHVYINHMWFRYMRHLKQAANLNVMYLKAITRMFFLLVPYVDTTQFPFFLYAISWVVGWLFGYFTTMYQLLRLCIVE